MLNHVWMVHEEKFHFELQIYLFRLVFIISEEHKQKRIKYTADNVEYYEIQYMLEHDRAIGYALRLGTEQAAQHPAQLS